VSSPRDPSRLSDQHVVRRALDGDEAAYSELLRRYQQSLLELIYRTVRNRERAEDLTQVTFINAFKKLDTYDPELAFGPWIRSIAINTALHYLEKKRLDSLNSGEALSPDELDALGIHASVPTDPPTPDPDARRIAAGLDQALKQLKPVHRRCFVLRHFEKRSYDDIAEIMGVPRNTVGTYLHRARKQLRDILGPLRESPESDPTNTPA
jgi:RNA polymerase sigma factor (sigma-70 family)